MSFTHTRADFPDGFTFGAATAAFQIEGGAAHRGRSHWDDFCATPGNVRGGDDGLVACDHYHRWEDDLDLLADGGFDAYRFSLSWPRILPEGEGETNEAGLDFYDRLIDGMLARGLRPFATLYHWDLPSALADRGGWRARDTAERFADYAALVARRYGDRLHSIATLNEPWCAGFLSHFLGVHAPGLRDVRAAARAMHHLPLAHGLAIRAMRAEGAANLGIVTNHEVCIGASDKAEDAAAARRWDSIINRWFLEGILRGAYPADVLEGFAGHMPDGFGDDMAIVSAPTDWHGVNYYTRNRFAHVEGMAWPSLRMVELDAPQGGQPGETTDMGWEVHPEGLTAVLEMVASHAGERPIFVTENGAAYDDPAPTNGALDDGPRVAYYRHHLAAAREAIARGVKLHGYFGWSVLDNFEWAEGYAKRFGMVHVDYDTQERTPKASYRAFQAMLR